MVCVIVTVITIQVSSCAGWVDEGKVVGIRRGVMGAVDVVMGVGAVGQNTLQRRGKYAKCLVPTTIGTFVYTLISSSLLSYQVPVIFACPPVLKNNTFLILINLRCVMTILYSVLCDSCVVNSNILIGIVLWVRTVGGWKEIQIS